MAGPRRLLLLPPLVLLLVAAGALLLPQRGSAEEGKVSLELYYESLCPYCSRFIVNHLAGILEDGLIDAVHLRLVPYGNARVGSNSEISCQLRFKFHQQIMKTVHWHYPVGNMNVGRMACPSRWFRSFLFGSEKL